ncbi:MAG: LysM peptidoglycan-binding domain-containing protein [Eubacterium sp.]|nr:LysM peptidoglycan-binding domain-containing protein [Eubacterium sp.]MDE5974228.1 LysM peptidoglycan-binding domain-containing protein [Eubacterium sp.]
MKMKFKDFTFPSNPKEIKINISSNIQSKGVYGGSSTTENVSVNPIIISGKGEFFDDNAEELCLYLQHMLRDKTAGELMLPSSAGLNAFLTEFTYSKNCRKGSTEYYFVFTESCNKTNNKRKTNYTIAEKNENAFEIAGRCNISVSDIMSLNDFQTPFSINEGDRVVLYGN